MPISNYQTDTSRGFRWPMFGGTSAPAPAPAPGSVMTTSSPTTTSSGGSTSPWGTNGTFTPVFGNYWNSIDSGWSDYGMPALASKIAGENLIQSQGLYNRYYPWANQTGMPGLMALADPKYQSDQFRRRRMAQGADAGAYAGARLGNNPALRQAAIAGGLNEATEQANNFMADQYDPVNQAQAIQAAAQGMQALVPGYQGTSNLINTIWGNPRIQAEARKLGVKEGGGGLSGLLGTASQIAGLGTGFGWW